MHDNASVFKGELWLTIAQKPALKKAAPKKGRASRVVMDESDDEVEEVKSDSTQ